MQATNGNFIKNIPNEVFLGVLEKLSSKDIQSFALTCKENYSLVYGAKLNKTNELFYHLIISKIKQGETSKVRKLIEDVEVDFSYKQHKIFRKTIKYNQADILKILLKEKKINPLSYRNEFQKGFNGLEEDKDKKILDRWGSNPIVMSSKKGYTQIIKILLKDGRIAIGLDYAIGVASMNGYVEIVKILLKNMRFNELDGINSGISLAANNGHFEVVKELLKNEDVNPERFDNNVLRLAIKNNHLEVVKMLLKNKHVNPAAKNNFAIIKASECGHLEIVKLLLDDERVNPGDNYNKAIIKASECGHLEIVKLLLADERVNPADWFNMALRRSAENGHLEIVKVLIENELVQQGKDFNVAITGAYNNGHLEIMDLLCDTIEPTSPTKKVINFTTNFIIQIYQTMNL